MFGLFAGAGLMTLMNVFIGVLSAWFSVLAALLILIGYIGHGRNAFEIRKARQHEKEMEENQ